MKDALWLTMVVVIGLLLPQFLGYLALRTIRKRKSMMWISLTVLVPPLLYLFISHNYWAYMAHLIEKSGDRACGAFGWAAVATTGTGTILNLLIAIPLQIYFRRKSKVPSNG